VSTVFDVTAVTVDADTSTTFSVAGVDEVVITDATLVPDITLDAPEAVSGVIVEVPGMQGPPGLKNVYVQENDPAVEYGWGPEEAGFIWIEVNV